MKKQKNANLLGDFKIHGNLAVWPKWQVVIPKSIRDLLWIQPGDNLLSITKCDKWLILIKAESILEFMEYIHNEILPKIDNKK